MWIRTKTRKEELWDALQEGIFGLFHFMEPITQCKLKIIQLTWIIRQMMYPVRPQKKKKPMKREGQACVCLHFSRFSLKMKHRY